MEKIKIFHGDNIVESRNSLSSDIAKAREKGIEVVFLEAAKTDLTGIRSALESGSLFGGDKLVVIENFFSLPQSSFKKKVLAYFKKGQFENSLIFWEGKKLGSIPLKAPTRLFRLDPVLFRFLDCLKEGKGKALLKLLAKAKENEKPEIIFYMLVRQIRLLILAKDLGNSGLSGLASWQKRKFMSQAKLFSLNHLLRFYRKLLEIDFAQKTSRDPFTFSSRLDLLISEL